MSSEYQIDIFQIPNVISDHIFKNIGSDIRITRKYVFISTPTTVPQSQFADMMVQNKYDVIALDYMDKAVDVAMTTKLISDAHKDIFDIAVIVSGNIALYPAIREVRSTGKQIMICNFSDKISSVYKETNYETGPLDFDILCLDNVLDAIASKIIDGEISSASILEEAKSEFFNGNLDYEKINLKKYITYWAIRARFLQLFQETMNEDDQDIVRKMFDKLNDLSSEYQPGYIKSLNKKWHPNSWEDEIKVVPKVW
jgi:uncharacterized LabA/DUF88 family protein